MEKLKVKKDYPSQLNTKSIACRIPIADYVSFLEDANEKGINLNDWLLTKIYGSGRSVSVGNYENELELNISADEILNILNTDDNGELYDAKRIYEHAISMRKTFGTTTGILFDKINRRWFNFFLFRKNFQGASK
jgi:hypothetical protein